MTLSAQENCTNGIDDDADGKIDLNDPDCICNASEVTSIIPNPSFEDHSGCPSSFSELSLATPWIQATEATTDYFNTCGFIIEGVINQGLDNFPDGNGIAGTLYLRDWNEYMGATLLSPMVAGTAYQLSFDIAALMMHNDGSPVPEVDVSSLEPVNVTLYGCTNGANLPLNTTFDPTSYDPTWVEIGHVTYIPVSVWGQVTISFTPLININAIMLGPPPVLPLSYPSNQAQNYPYFIYDDLLLNTAASFGVNVTQTGNFCEDNLVLTAITTVTVSPSATYQWYLNGIAIAGATSVTHAVPAFATNLGEYSVMVTDGGTCYTSVQQTINNVVPSPDFTTVQPTCIVITGSITITTPGSEYSFDNGVTWQVSNVKSGLPVGTYYIKIKTPNGCISSGTGVNILQPQLLENSNITVVQPVTCDGTGSITVNAPNAAQYSFDDGVTWTTNPTINNLQPGTYLVKIKDAAGCQSNSQYILINRVYLDYPIYSIVQPTCGVGGTISISTVAAEYSFDDGVTWTTNPIAANLPAGSYLIKIRDSAGCESYTQYVYLNEFYLSVNVTYNVVQPVCGTGGSITISTLATEYSFDGGVTWQASNTITGLDPGYYMIQIKNELGCVSNPQYVSLDFFYLPNPDFTVVQPSCGVGGSITVTTPASFYSFDGGSTWTTNPTASNLNPGTYYVMIKNDLGCTSSYLYANLSQYYLPNPDYVVVNPSCGNIGSITVTTPGVECSFNGGPWTTNLVFNNLLPGYYYIKIRNSLGCESNYVNFYLDNTNLAYPNYTIVQPGCGTGGSITITTPAAQYSFDGGSTWTTNPVMTNLNPGYYALRIKNTAGCTSDYLYVSLDTFYLPDPAYTAIQPTCGTAGSITFTTAAAEYSFDGGSTWTTNPVKNNLTYGYYYLMVRNSAGCTSNTMYVFINQFYLPDPSVTVVQPTCATGGSITFNTVADQYSFDGGITWTTNPVLTNVPPGYYPVMIKSNLGCTSNSQYIFLDQFYLPTPFFTVVQPTCSTGGTITITTLADQYSFDGGTTWTTNPVRSNMAAGYYSIVIKNSAGCVSYTQYVNLSEYHLPSPAFTIVDAACGNGGSITITSIADQYSFDDGITWTTNPVATNLPQGYYYIKVKSNAGCTSYTQYAYVYSSSNPPAAPTVSTVQPAGCTATNGSITVTSAAVLYSFDNGVTWSPSPTMISIGGGTYLVKIKQTATGCPSDATAVVLSGSNTVVPAPAYTTIQPSCTAAGSITITTTGSEYSFDNGVTWSATNTLGSLSNGIYILKIKNNDGCISLSNTVTINPVVIPAAPNFTVVQPLCGTPANITITTSATQYSFDDGLTWTANPVADNLTPGTYTIRIKNNGCPSNPIPVVILSPVGIPAAPDVTILQPISCINPFGLITITSAAAEYSFDNGVTYTTNPIVTNAAIGTYNIKVKNSAGCESPAVIVTIDAPADFPTDPIISILQPDCTNSQGNITVTSVASEYSFNNGTTWVTSATSPMMNAGTYSVKIKNAAGCISNAVPGVIIPYTGTTPTPIALTPQVFCIQDNSTLTDVAISGQNIKWYDAATGGSILLGTTLLANNTTYYATQSIGPCESGRIPVLVNIQNTPAPTGTNTQSFCSLGNPDLSSIVVVGSNIQWYDAAGNPLPVTTALVNGATYYATQNISGCESVTKMAFTITLISSLSTTNYASLLCDDLNNGTETVDLSDYNTNLIANPANYSFSYYNSLVAAQNQQSSGQITNFSNHGLTLGINLIYVRIDSPTLCFGISELELTVVSKPLMTFADVIPLCKGNAVTITADLGYDSYLWSTGATASSISVSTPGDYNVTVTKNYGTFKCTTIKDFKVVISDIASITSIQTDDWTDDQNMITVYANGPGHYQYSLDGIHYQDSNQFTGLQSGTYLVYVNDTNGCGFVKDEVFLLMYPKFFTPNDDGFNDTWKIKLSENEVGFTIKLFDRYGKLLKHLGNNMGWDGKFNGQMLPSTDYWFVVTRENGKEYRGHFTLKR